VTDDSRIQGWKSRTTKKSKQPWKTTKCNICTARTKQNKTKVWFSSHFMPSTQEIDRAYPTFPRTCQCDFAELETSRGAFQHVTGPIRTWENDLKHLYYTFTLSVLHINLPVCCQSSREYLTGTCRRFSNSNAGSTANSFPAAFRNALVQRTFRGFRFFLNALWHLARQNRNNYNRIHITKSK